MDRVVGVRAAVEANLGWSLLPKLAAQKLLRRGDLIQLDLRVSLKDELCLWWLRNRRDLTASAKLLQLWLSAEQIERLNHGQTSSQ